MVTTASENGRQGLTRQMSLSHLLLSVLPREMDHGVVTNDYVMMNEVGKGSFGTVYLCRRKDAGEDGPQYVCKTISKTKLRSQQDIDDIRREVKISAHLTGHDRVVSFHGAYEDEEAIHLILEYCPGGELLDRIIARGQFSEKDVSKVVKKMLESIDYMAEMGVVHRDIKLQNFLLTSSDPGCLNIKASDFGLSTFAKPGETFEDLVGSLYFMAPEVIFGKHGTKADVWSVGVCAYVLLAGNMPFTGPSQGIISQCILREPVNVSGDLFHDVSKPAKDFLQKALTKDAAKRPSAADLLAHPWVTSCDSMKPLSDGLLHRIRQFSMGNAFKKRAMMLVAEHMPASEMEGLKLMFEAMDRDGSGTITIAEFHRGLKERGHKGLKEGEIRELVADADVDGDGVINYSEFLAATLHAARLDQEEVLHKTFEDLDTDGSGDLDADEVLSCMRSCFPQMTREEVVAIIDAVDANKDGRVQYAEFVEMLKSQNDLPFRALHDAGHPEDNDEGAGHEQPRTFTPGRERPRGEQGKGKALKGWRRFFKFH